MSRLPGGGGGVYIRYLFVRPWSIVSLTHMLSDISIFALSRVKMDLCISSGSGLSDWIASRNGFPPRDKLVVVGKMTFKWPCTDGTYLVSYRMVTTKGTHYAVGTCLGAVKAGSAVLGSRCS